MTAPPASFDLPAVVKLESCEHLHGFLQQSTELDVSIQCGAVERLHTLAAQMLLCAAQSWAANGRNFTLIDLSDACKSQLATLGLDPFPGGAEPTQ